MTECQTHRASTKNNLPYCKVCDKYIKWDRLDGKWVLSGVIPEHERTMTLEVLVAWMAKGNFTTQADDNGMTLLSVSGPDRHLILRGQDIRVFTDAQSRVTP